MTLTSQIEAASGVRKKSLTKNKSFRQKKKKNNEDESTKEVPASKKETKNEKIGKTSKKKESKIEKKEVIEEDVKSEEEEFGIKRTSSLKRGLGWIRRSFSFSKGLDYDPVTWRKKTTSWSASLTSLPEGVADDGTASTAQQHFRERKGVSRTQSLLMPSPRAMDTFPFHQDLSGGLGQRTVSHQGGLQSSYHFSCYDQIDFSDYASHSVHSLPSLVHQPHDFSSSRFRRLFSEELGAARRPKYGGGGGNGTGAGGTRLRRQAAFKNSESSLFATASSTKVGGTTSRRRGSACSGAGSRDVSPSGGDAAEASQHHGGNTSWASSQDWRRLVGSIRRRVRGRSTASAAAPVPADATSAMDSGGTMPAFMTSSDPTVRDDFLRATMRIFLVVSPPMGRLQGRSRSLTHLDCLDPADVRLDEVEPPLPVAAGTTDSLIAPMEQENRLIVPSTEPHHTRRKKLARSQVSSSEYFSVSFECGGSPGEDSSTLPNEEFIPATKGTALGDALRAVCARRGLDLTNLEVFLESSRTPLPIVTDTSWLGGKHVRLRVRDDKSPVRGLKANQVPLRKASGSYRGKGGRFFSASTEDPNYVATADSSHEGSIKGSSKASSKQRWSGLFGNSKDTKMESLVDQLNSYSKHGIPRLQNTDDSDSDEGVYELEEDWQDVVTLAGELSERARQQQTAIWELLSTEVAYIKTLKVVTDLFLACLCSLQAANILNEVDKAKLFSNIPDIYAANRHFWCNYLLPMLTESRKTGQPLNPQLLLEGFRRFQDIFLPYTKYCAEQSQCQQYCRERHQENDVFTAYLVWCETQKECNRLRLMDIVVKPMQRLTKYSLLLKAIHKNTENEEQRESLAVMIKCVDQFVNDVNSTLRQRQDHERLKGIIARIESYDVVETKDDEVERILKLHSELDLTCPMPGCHVTQRRYLLLESDLKLKDNSTSKMDVHCFLLTDMLLVCKPITKKGGSGSVRVVRQPYLVDRLVVQELARDPPSIALVYLNEFQTATAAFILYSQEQKLIKNWVEGIKKAQDLYAAAKSASNIAQPSHLNTSSPAVPLASISRQPSACFYEDEDSLLLETDYQSCASYSAGLLPSNRSPRGGSSRGSRGSSLMHSHSGSVDMNEASSVSSVSQSRGVSMENELRGSSLSSDEGLPVATCSCDSGKSANQITQPPLPVPSPRPERRSQLSKSPSPNTLSVQVPVFSSLGQSLPNLNLATSPSSGHVTASPPNPPSSLLLVPPAGNKTQHHGGLLSPGHRGISYPPPSPPRGSLRRGFALTQTRNPPLLKTRHINSTIVTPNIPSPTNSQCSSLTASYDFDVPVITGVSPPREGRMTPEPPEVAGAGPIRSHPHRHPMMKRLTRTDNRRYHTAGAIDDIKDQQNMPKQDSRDASIHKRLSWNCGQQQQQQQQHQQEVGMSNASNIDLAKKCTSSESVQSSSGVSSTGSAQYGGELDLLDLDGPSLRLMCGNTLDCCLDPSSIRDGKSEAGLPLSPAMEAINMELLRSRLSPLPLDLEGSQSQSRDDEDQQKENENKAELLRMKDLILTQGEASKV